MIRDLRSTSWTDDPASISARFGGEGASDRDNIQKLLREMEGVQVSREGHVRCSIAVVSPDGREAVVEGSCRGRIGFKEVGKRGFGYDPLFVLPDMERPWPSSP